MLLYGITVGNVDITANELSVTDPCYKYDTWCRLNGINIKPGNYDCIAYLGSKTQDKEELQKEYEEWAHKYHKTLDEYIESKIRDISSRVFRLIMLHNECNPPLSTTDVKDKWEPIGRIGVDAGLAGFVWNQGIYDPSSDERWQDLLDRLAEEEAEPYVDDETGEEVPHRFHLWPEYGFFSSSGYGDGSYDVYKLERDGEIVGLKVDF